MHANNQLLADTRATEAYSLPMGVEPSFRNEELASIDIDVDKSAWVDVQLVDVGGCDHIQTTRRLWFETNNLQELMKYHKQ